jgi:hypothetical protein
MAENWLNFTNVGTFSERSTLNDQHGLLRQNRFVVLLNAPTAFDKFKGNGWLEWQVLNFNCPNITMDVDSMEVNGWSHYYLKGRSDSEFEITFLESSDLILRYFFFEWMKAGFNHVTGRRNYISEVQAHEMKIAPLNYKGDAVRADCFYGVFPIDVNSLDYDVTTEDTMLKTTVKFKYIFHTVEDMKGSTNHAAYNQ